MPVHKAIEQRPRLDWEALAEPSQVRIVRATDEERRRIGRDLHDGAQQRIVALALRLRCAQRELGGGAEAAFQHLLAETVDELEVAVQELRDLACGVHPAILTEEGLEAALESLTSRSPLAVSLDVCGIRLPPWVESTAYFVVCEALANVVKHAHASRAAVSTRLLGGVLVVLVEDDGVGGAQVSGSGLRGLADRVDALGGRIDIQSRAEAGTRILAEIPCGP
jgi:signal transduction histidine kinase